MAMKGEMEGFDSNYFEDEEDSLQQAVKLTEPIPYVRRQAYILIVGDPGTGKSMLSRSFTRFPRMPAKRYHSIAIHTGKYRNRKKTSIGLHFFCAPIKSEDDGCFRKKSPENHPYDLLIYLFDVNRRTTFRSVFSKWHIEVTAYLGSHRLPPSLLVGNKIDLRPAHVENSTLDTVGTHEGEMSASLVEAEQYVEVCALAEINTRNLLVKILKLLNITWEPDF